MTHYNETQISCLDDEDLLIDLVTQNCRTKYNLDKLTLMHMGLIIIGIQPLIRPGLGTKTLISLLDTRWIGSMSKANLGMIEADISETGGLFYCAPGLLLNSQEFFRKIKIGIQTRGFKDLEKGSKNLLICTYYIGKLMQVKTPKYHIDIRSLASIVSTDKS